MPSRVKREKVDLRTVNPSGRVDVLAYKSAEYVTKHLEAKQGLSGVWDAIEPHAQDFIQGALMGIPIPPELKMVLGVIQANWGKFELQNPFNPSLENSANEKGKEKK